ncbi:MAG: hypothetical protein LZF62_180071 [Nitrospira sp.]|nr:MAG: hypothetical protein LZF62_180071 [Nitrospira sp.]
MTERRKWSVSSTVFTEPVVGPGIRLVTRNPIPVLNMIVATITHKALQGFLLVLLVGCSTTYEPHLVLPPGELDRSIDAAVEVHPFVAADDLLFGHSNYGVVADDYANKPPSQLTQTITQQVTTELAAHRVFRKVSTYDPSPDLILTGRIERFFEHDRRKLWTFIPYYSNKLASLFRVNSYATNGEIHLTLTLLKPTGEVLGSYVGHSSFNEDYTPNSEVRPGDRLNRALGQAVAQIRDEMFADTTLAKTRKTPLALQ